MYSILVELSPGLVESSKASVSVAANEPMEPSSVALAAAAVASEVSSELPEPLQGLIALWRAHHLSSPSCAVTSSGFAVLDAELPGGGWPHRVLTELLLPHPGLGE